MQECKVCQMLFLGGGSCPSCGSQVSVDLSDIKSENLDDDGIPGLDLVAVELGSEDEGSQSGEILPFGMGAKAEVLDSHLPFGVGSMLESSSMNEPEIEEGHSLDDSPVESKSEPEIEVEPVTDAEEEIIESPEVPIRIEASIVPEEPIQTIVESIPEIELPEPIVNVEKSSNSVDVPDIWRIDAAEVNMEEIYAETEKIVEVSYGDELEMDEIHVQFDELHHEADGSTIFSIDDSPELHPARAMEVNTAGDMALEKLIESAFGHMGSNSWLQAAQVLQGASAMSPNDPAILNNMGLAILQQSLEMDSAGDAMASSQYESAIMALRQAAKQDATDNTILLNLAHALLVSGRTEKALKVVEVLCFRDLGNVEAENVRGACLIQMGRSEEAKEVLSPYSDDSLVAANLNRI
jgi:hypothetical protein